MPRRKELPLPDQLKYVIEDGQIVNIEQNCIGLFKPELIQKLKSRPKRPIKFTPGQLGYGELTKSIATECFDDNKNKLSIIWRKFTEIKEEREEKGLIDDVFYIPKGIRIEGLGSKKYLGGKLTYDILAINDVKTKSLSLIYSFKPNNCEIAQYHFQRKEGSRHETGYFSPDDIFGAWNHYNLSKYESFEAFLNDVNN